MTTYANSRNRKAKAIPADEQKQAGKQVITPVARKQANPSPVVKGAAAVPQGQQAKGSLKVLSGLQPQAARPVGTKGPMESKPQPAASSLQGGSSESNTDDEDEAWHQDTVAEVEHLQRMDKFMPPPPSPEQPNCFRDIHREGSLHRDKNGKLKPVKKVAAEMESGRVHEAKTIQPKRYEWAAGKDGRPVRVALAD